MPRAMSAVAFFVLCLVCPGSAGPPPADLPAAEGVLLPQALTSAGLRFSAAGDKLLVVREYGEGTAPLVTVHDTRPQPRQGRGIFFPLSSADLIGGNAPPGAGRYGTSAEFGPDGNQVVTTAYRTARLWDISRGQNGRWPTPVAIDLPGSAAATFSRDGKRLLTASLVGGEKQGERTRFEVRSWDVAGGKWAGGPGGALVRERIGPRPTLRGLVQDPDGAFLLTAAGGIQSDAESAQLWDAKTLAPVGEPLGASGSAYYIGPGGKTLLACSRRELAVWDLAAGKVACALPTPEVAREWPSAAYDVRSRPWFAAHPNGTSVLYRRGDRVGLWDLGGDKPTEKAALKHSGPVYWVAISHDGKLAATACERPDEVLVWAVEAGKPLLKVPHNGKVEAMEFSPNGRLLATAGAGDIYLWNLDSKK